MKRDQPPGQGEAAEMDQKPCEDTLKLNALKIPGRPARSSPEQTRKRPHSSALVALERRSEGASEAEHSVAIQETQELAVISEQEAGSAATGLEQDTLELPRLDESATAITYQPTRKLSVLEPGGAAPAAVLTLHNRTLSRGQAFCLLGLLLILVLNATSTSFAQFIGAQGWAFVLSGSAAGNSNVVQHISTALRQHTPAPGTRQETTPQLTPQQYIDLIVQNMSLDQKLGQMLFVQFTGPTYSLDLNVMVTQYNVGAVILFTANNNIISASQLKQLTAEMQSNARNAGSGIPLIIATDQEGGLVDRLRNLDGPRPSAAQIGATHDPAQARAAGIQDAHDLASYGINLNLAPVVDVTSVYNPQLYTRTFGSDPTTVTRMAAAYLQGLQESGKVIGTLKHFPGLGDVSVDPHTGLPYLIRPRSYLEANDWAPYRTLIRQGNVHAVMVTHEIVTAVDSSTPSSLSHKVITGILRDGLGFQGVVMTDSLTMEGITAHYLESQAAVMAVQAGADLLMGAVSADTAASMLQALKEAVQAGQISQQRIDQSVHRILMLKYEMGLLQIPQ